MANEPAARPPGEASPSPTTDPETFWSQAGDFTPAVLVERDGLRFFVSTADRNIGRRVFLKGRYAKAQLDQVGRVLAGVGLLDRTQDQTVVNVGANIGTVVVPLVKQLGFAQGVACEPEPANFDLVKQLGFAQGVACEPEPANFDLLRLNILANGLEDRITAVRAAIGTSETEVAFGVFEGRSGTHMVVRDEGLRSEFTEHGEARIIQVPATTLDALLGEHRVDPDRVGLVWSDTQGHEAHVLRGASQLLERPVPMLIEFHPGLLGDSLGNLQHLVGEYFTHVLDVRRAKRHEAPAFQPVASMPQLAEAYLERRQGEFTDLLLVNL